MSFFDLKVGRKWRQKKFKISPSFSLQSRSKMHSNFNTEWVRFSTWKHITSLPRFCASHDKDFVRKTLHHQHAKWCHCIATFASCWLVETNWISSLRKDTRHGRSLTNHTGIWGRNWLEKLSALGAVWRVKRGRWEAPQTIIAPTLFWSPKEPLRENTGKELLHFLCVLAATLHCSNIAWILGFKRAVIEVAKGVTWEGFEKSSKSVQRPFEQKMTTRQRLLRKKIEGFSFVEFEVNRYKWVLAWTRTWTFKQLSRKVCWCGFGDDLQKSMLWHWLMLCSGC